MTTHQLSSNAWQLTQFSAINAFLVREPDGFTLIDTCIGQASQIVAAARKLGTPIRRVVLTHAHGDHAGSLDALAEVLDGVEVLVSRREARLLAGDKSLEAGEATAKLRGNYSHCATKPTRLLADGDRVGSLEVIATPGHTPGHIALFDTRDRSIFAGDAWSILGGLSIAGQFRPLFPLPAMATWHHPTAIVGARRVIGMQPTLLAVGHGRALAAPIPAMQEELQVCERRASANSSASAMSAGR